MNGSVINEQTLKCLPVITEEYVENYKFQKWCSLFYDKTNKETYLNRTKSAMKVYDCSSYGSAGSIGYQNFKKLQNWRGVLREYAEEQGITLPVLFRKAIDKFNTTNNPEWMKIIMRMMSESEFVDEVKNQTLIQNNLTQTNTNMAVNIVTYKDAGTTEDNNTSVQLQSPEVSASTS